MSTSNSSPKRLITFIDGFNLYFGIKTSKLKHRLWLDLAALAKTMVPREYVVDSVKYFTARILNLKEAPTPPAAASSAYLEAEVSRQRQADYIDAVRTTGVQVYEGHFKRRMIRCRACGAEWCKPEEKMTDVRIATEILSAAFRGEFEAAMVISGDADIVPPIRVVVQDIGLPVIVSFPPGRKLQELVSAATDVRHIRDEHLENCQLPDVVTCGGVELRRPAAWS